jgi:hypothetical protein
MEHAYENNQCSLIRWVRVTCCERLLTHARVTDVDDPEGLKLNPQLHQYDILMIRHRMTDGPHCQEIYESIFCREQIASENRRVG